MMNTRPMSLAAPQQRSMSVTNQSRFANSMPSMHQNVQQTQQPPTNNALVYDRLLHLYYRDPVAFAEIIELDLFRTKSVLQNTVFEEADLYNSFEKAYIFTEKDGEEDIQHKTELRTAVKNLFVQAAMDDDHCPSLISFHMLLYKRIKILEKVQEFQHLRLNDLKRLKSGFETMSLTTAMSGVNRDENIALLKNLQKAMQKSDVKRGLFAKLRKSRSEAVYKLLSKHTGPVSMPNSDMAVVQDYLMNFSSDRENSVKRKSKSILSLFLLALGKGSLLDMLMVLSSMLSITTTTPAKPPTGSARQGDFLPNDETDEGGISLRPETIKSLQRFQAIIYEKLSHIQTNNFKDEEKNNAQFDPQRVIKNPEYNLPNSTKKPISVRRLFVFLLSHLDLLASAYLSGPGLLYSKTVTSITNNTVNISFCVEALPQTFEVLRSLLDRLLSADVGNDNNANYARMYSAVAVLRLLRINIESLSLWKKDQEQLSSLTGRISQSTTRTVSNDFLVELKEYFFQILRNQQPEEVKTENIEVDSASESTVPRTSPRKSQQKNNQKGGSVQNPTDPDELQYEISHADCFVVITKIPSPSPRPVQYYLNERESEIIVSEMASIICTGFTLFFASHVMQKDFIIDAIRTYQPRSLKSMILYKVLQKMTDDSILFDSFMIQGIGSNESPLPFLNCIITFLKKNTQDKLRQPEANMGLIDGINLYFQRLLLMWLNHLVKVISGVYVRSKASTLPTISLSSGTGKILLEYGSGVLEASAEILSAACSELTELEPQKENQEAWMMTKQRIEQTLHDSLFGRQAFPLLEAFIKFMWRCGHSQEETQQMQKLTAFLYPYVTDILRSVNLLNTLLEKSDKPFEWYIVETDHPYESSINQKIEVAFDKPDEQTSVVAVAVKFDPRCRTAAPSDNLRISGNNGVPNVQALQFSGFGNTIPVNPLMTWGNSMNLTFMSDDKHTDWGMRCAVYPVFDQNWLYEIEKKLGWLGGRCCAFVLSSYPYSPDETLYASWLCSQLFTNGLEINEWKELSVKLNLPVNRRKQSGMNLKEGHSLPVQEEEEKLSIRDQFLQDLVHAQNRAGEMIKFIYDHLRNEGATFLENADIIASERAVIAAVLKHTDLVGVAIRFTDEVINYQSSMKSKPIPPSGLLMVWRNARKIRMWMASKKQKQQTQYHSIKEFIVQKAQFLASLRSATFAHVPAVGSEQDISTPVDYIIETLDRQTRSNAEPIVSQQQQSSSTNLTTMKVLKGVTSQKMNNREQALSRWKQILVLWRIGRKWKLHTLRREGVPHISQDDKRNIDRISDLVLTFVQSDIIPSRIQALMSMRKERALNRARAFRMYTELLTCTQYGSVKAEILQGAKEILKSRSMKKHNSVDFHYFNNIEGCGPVYNEVLADSFNKFLQAVMSEFEPTDYNVLNTGLLREILDSCFFSFKPSDIEWVLALDFLQKLCPLMYDQGEEVASTGKFKKSSSRVEEKKDNNKRAWKIFRLLSVRCVEMLEEWDEREMHQIQVVRRANVRSRLNQLRDKIFGLLFDELEKMSGHGNPQPAVLEEMLSLMVSLCSTESAQASLSSTRFQRLLLPLLKLGFPRVQELALQLCGQIILGQPQEEGESQETVDLGQSSLLNVLFDFLGSYEIRQVVGSDPQSPDSSPMGLRMAREVFSLIRRLFDSNTSSAHWKKTISAMIQKLLEESYASLNSILETQKDLKVGFDKLVVTDDMIKTFKHILSSITLINGFRHIPEVGEDVQVLLNGKWMDVTVTCLEENRHTAKVLIKDEKVIHKVQRVPFENLRTLTEDPLQESAFDFTQDFVKSLFKFVQVCGDTISTSHAHCHHHHKADDSSAQILFTNLWTRTLHLIDQWANQDKSAIAEYLFKGDMEEFQSLLKYAEHDTKIMYGTELKLDSCSYAFTGKRFTRQHYYSCITCGMSNTRAVCSACARTCHRGHRLGAPEVGEFYCDCGSGEGKFPCKSLKTAAPDAVPSLERFESLTLRLQQAMQLRVYLQNHSHEQQAQTQTGNDESKGPTSFLAPYNGLGYSVDTINAHNEITFSHNTNGLSMVGTDNPVPVHWPGFYFEVEITNSGKANSAIALGFAEEVRNNRQWPDVLEGSYTYHITNGSLYRGSQLFKSQFGAPCAKGDVIGCGYTKEHKVIFFTRNGTYLGNAFTNVNFDGKNCFPVIHLRGDRLSIRTNLSGQFQFALARAYKSIYTAMVSSQSGNRQLLPNTSLPPSTESEVDPETGITYHKLMMDELATLGFPEVECKNALQQYPNNLNAAAAWLYRSRTRPLRHQLADELIRMGFEPELCLKALKICKDNVQVALNWLLDGNTLDGDVVEDPTSEQDDKGVAFLGATAHAYEIKSLTMKGILQNPEIKINENTFSDVQLAKVNVDDLLVVSPYLNDDKKNLSTNASIARMQSQIGVVVRKMGNGAHLQTIDPVSGDTYTAFVSTQHLMTPPQEFRSISLSNLTQKVASYYTITGTLLCRKILRNVYSQGALKTINIPQPNYAFVRSQLYKSVKILFLDQYQLQDHNMVAVDPQLDATLQTLTQQLNETKVQVIGENNSKLATYSMFDHLVPESFKELNEYLEAAPHTRKIDFKSEYLGTKHLVRFWGASSIVLTFSKCTFAINDMINFYFDSLGKKPAIQPVKGPGEIPNRLVISGDHFFFEFKTVSLVEGSGFYFYATPSSHRLDERQALSQPNLALATLCLRNASRQFWHRHMLREKIGARTFEKVLQYITTPFAPFKKTVCEAFGIMCTEISDILRTPNQPYTPPSLVGLKRFRSELQDLYIEFQKYNEVEAMALPNFHALLDLMSIIRTLLASDLCVSSFSQESKYHIYSYQDDAYTRQIKACTSCMMTSTGPNSVPKYHSQDVTRCQAHSARQLEWWKGKKVTQSDNTHFDTVTDSNLVPIERLNVNPSDWFEHVSWVDQIAIVRELCECFIHNRRLPDWVLFEAALEKKKKVSYRESPHPYSVIKDAGDIVIPGAKTIFISFDKHSKTHKSEKLLFSNKFKGADDLGAFGGDELKDKTIIVHGNRVFYTFKSVGDDHECTCNNCATRIVGVRYHCTECDDYDLCDRCVRKSRVHNETHLFLKIRRPVDCVPAALPHLYTNRWTNTTQFRTNVHTGVKCNGCGAFPIRGVRFWCENCEDYNLCEKCADEEYKHHDRMHVFLRVVRPLAPKQQLPANALPYGLVYEKDMDTHWGYLFSVSSSDSYAKYDDPKIIKIMSEIATSMNDWTNPRMDAQLVEYVESFCNGWQSLEWEGLSPKPNQLVHFPMLTKPTLKSLRYRFTILKMLNRKISRVLHLLDLNSCDTNDLDKIQQLQGRSEMMSLSTLVAAMRERIFRSVKMDLWQHTITKSLVEANPITLKLNRHKAAEDSENPLLRAFNSMFNQAYKQFQAMNPKEFCRKGGAWKVTFVGEAADDYGGPFRESLTQMCSELQTDQMDLLIRVPNYEHGVGENREKYMPNPRANANRHIKWYRFLGEILGVGLLSKNVMPLDLPSLFWKAIVKQPIVLSDLEAIDQSAAQSMRELRDIDLRGVTAEDFENIIIENFTTKSSDGTEVELVENGRNITVTYDTRHEYSRLVEQYRLHKELRYQIDAIRDGLYSVVPPRFFPIFTWHELEMLICGSPIIDLEVLKKHTTYEGYTATSREVKDFWQCLESFDSNERSLYLRFVWGRSRLPITEEGFANHHMKIQRLDRHNHDSVLPLSHTCFFSIELPPYSNITIMRQKLLYAITHCTAIDTDFTTVANEARNINILE